jgi:uracil-DNA glycosylase
VREIGLLSRLRVVVVLGAFGYEAAWTSLREAGFAVPARRPRFGHGVEVDCGRVTIIGSYHPSQQNTFTGKLTEPMLDAVFSRAQSLMMATTSPSA